MKQIEHFVPGVKDQGDGVLSRLRWPIPPGVTQTYVEAYSDPGDVVLVPYCQGPAVVREILGAERRALAVHFDPSLALLVRMALAPLPARDVDSAVARLGDSLKQGMPLRRYLEGLYATTCPACLRPAIADFFVWDRDQDGPTAKSLRCRACAWDGQTAIDGEDRDRLAEVPVRGMHYHYVLDRVAPHPQASAHRNRMEPLLHLYTPRNLYALAEITLKIESLFPDGPERQVLNALLLDCLDRCSSLDPQPATTDRRRGLSRPGRFLERNVWVAFEEAITRLQSMGGEPVPRFVDRLDAFQMSDSESTGLVGAALVRDLFHTIPLQTVRLVLTSPPPLDSAAWTLSYFWGAWLFGTEAVDSLRPLLRQRTPDPAWYGHVMSSSLRSLTSLLCRDGRIVLVLARQRTAVVEAMLIAASRARLGVAALVQCGADYRLELMPDVPQARPASHAPLRAEIGPTVIKTATETIQARGEPVLWRTLHAAIQRRLAETGLMTRALGAEGEGSSALDLIAEETQTALDDHPFACLPGGRRGETFWWLLEATGVAPPLSDRVELVSHKVLQDAATLTELDFARLVYARFPGSLVPDTGLVAICLREYGHEVSPGRWQLRAEDWPATRQAERQTIIEHLLSLGQRLGFRATPGAPFDAAWFEGDRMRACFVVRWQAAVSEALALGRDLEEAIPYLVIPGGRAALVSYKLARNPLWQQTVERAGWRFIKYRHVRQLVSEPEVDEYALRTIVGLDPIVEKEIAQLSLF